MSDQQSKYAKEKNGNKSDQNPVTLCKALFCNCSKKIVEIVELIENLCNIAY